ncbi:VC0807 family protein [Pseudonocardia saturnea]
MTAPPPPRALRTAARTVLDLAVPLVLFCVLLGLGAGEITALAVGAVPPLLGALWTAVRHRRADGSALTVLAVMVLGLLAALISGDPRDVLVRGALLSLPAGVMMLASLRLRQPVTFQATRALLPHRAERMDRMWETDPRLRRAYRAITVIWGSVLLAEGGLRVLMAYTLPVAILPALETALAVATILVLQLPTHLLLRRAGVWHQLFAPRHVDADPTKEERHVHTR